MVEADFIVVFNFLRMSTCGGGGDDDGGGDGGVGILKRSGGRRVGEGKWKWQRSKCWSRVLNCGKAWWRHRLASHPHTAAEL
ncbi:hypothetical protein E2C01_097894 [Portunus trituberculatus]|uniref:Uncharacterized protein n=1 Tax=Portunus trituberculatus TaxID=210409 RepID=A0A5B7K6Y2_PORTR|nr:hypothetical protein [Portunus trituberculatus]